MKWTKRLKWVRLSKVIIPIALAISLIFAGFTVYAHEAENFVVTIGGDDGVKLSLALEKDLSDQKVKLVLPIDNYYDNVTFDPNEKGEMNANSVNLPDDIARRDGVHSIYTEEGEIGFYSFSCYLVNHSERAVDVDIRLTIDEVTYGNECEYHMDDAVRVMFIEGAPLLSENTYTIYQKADRIYDPSNEKMQKLVTEYEENIQYHDTINFVSEDIIFERRSNDLGFGIRDMEPFEVVDEENHVYKGVRRFTVALWLEGWDPECTDRIAFDRVKMSLHFDGK